VSALCWLLQLQPSHDHPAFPPAVGMASGMLPRYEASFVIQELLLHRQVWVGRMYVRLLIA